MQMSPVMNLSYYFFFILLHYFFCHHYSPYNCLMPLLAVAARILSPQLIPFLILLQGPLVLWDFNTLCTGLRLSGTVGIYLTKPLVGVGAFWRIYL